VGTAEFDALDPASAADLVRAACSSSAWLSAIVDNRPYRTVDALLAFSDRTITALSWPDVEAALAGHPRIGERAARAGAEAAFSRQEQAGAADAGQDVAAALRAGNLAYEQRFGYVFLICATGRTAEEMLDALTERLGNDPATEQEFVRRELAAIIRLRLAKILG